MTDFCEGQFYDYLHLLSLTGLPSDKHALLMNGDLVDRGSWSIEVIITAFAFKCTLYLRASLCDLLSPLLRALPDAYVH